MKDSAEEARRWRSQAAEKAAKAVHYQQGARIVIGHSIFQLIGKIAKGKVTRLRETAKLLDQFYIASRYPNDCKI